MNENDLERLNAEAAQRRNERQQQRKSEADQQHKDRKAREQALKAREQALIDAHLTVSQLIKLLEGMPADALVWHEGCDCCGRADRVELLSDGSVLIGRNN